MSAKRWDHIPGMAKMVEVTDGGGNYVLSADYDAVQQRCRDLEGGLRSLVQTGTEYIAKVEASATVPDEVAEAACRLLGYLQTGELYELGDVSTVASFVVELAGRHDDKWLPAMPLFDVTHYVARSKADVGWTPLAPCRRVPDCDCPGCKAVREHARLGQAALDKKFKIDTK